MIGKEKIILPQKYYLDYFKEVLRFITDHSSHLLDVDDHQFYEIFHELSEDAQCTIIRMVNRKGLYFRMDKFSYEEIENQAEAFDELVEVGFASFEFANDPVLFNYLTKAELDKLYPGRTLKSKYKEEILLELAETATAEEYQELHAKYPLIKIDIQDHIEFLKMLYFGNTHSMMTEFVIRDVGNIRLENFENHQFTSWFSSRNEALAVFELSNWNQAIKLAFATFLPEEVQQIIAPVNWSNLLQFNASRKPGDNLMLKLGEYFEKAGLLEVSMSYYELARKHPARERRIRILDRLGQLEDALDLAQTLAEQPFNAKEQIFALDYIAKKNKKTLKSTTEKIKTSSTINIVPDNSIRVETQALSYFAEQGFDGIHSENFLWKNLFGLLYWDILFDKNYNSFHNPLQRMPSDLYKEDFYHERKIELEATTSRIKSKKQLIVHITGVAKLKEGINNPLIYWHKDMVTHLERMIQFLPLKGLKNVMLEIAKNVKDNCTGFPDLLIWNESQYQFYEIKSPNDHLSAQQLFWINFLQKNKIKAEILRIIYSELEA